MNPDEQKPVSNKMNRVEGVENKQGKPKQNNKAPYDENGEKEKKKKKERWEKQQSNMQQAYLIVSPMNLGREPLVRRRDKEAEEVLIPIRKSQYKGVAIRWDHLEAPQATRAEYQLYLKL